MSRTITGQAGSLQANLDSGISNTAILKKGKNMATDLQRIRVKTGEAADGTPVYKKVNAHTQPELADNIVLEYIRNGRIWEFMTPQQVEAMQTTPTVREYAARWMGTFKKPKLKPGTYNNYWKYLNRYILPALGEKQLHTITVIDVQELLNSFQDKAKSTLENALSILGQMLDFAREEYSCMPVNPCKSKLISIPTEKETQRKALTLEEFEDISNNLYKLNEEDAMLLAIPMYTGLRRGEVLGLKWEDIDIENRLIHIRRSVTHAGTNNPVIGTPKTKAGERDVYLSEHLLKYLDRPGRKGFVFGGEKPVTFCHYNNTWERINKKIDLHGATLHSLRHTYITLCSTETDIKTLQGVAGHSTIAMTMDRYAHTQTSKVAELGRHMDSTIFSFDGHELDTGNAAETA